MITQKDAQELIGATKYFTWDELCRTVDVLYDWVAERDAHLTAAQNTIRALEGILEDHGIELRALRRKETP